MNADRSTISKMFYAIDEVWDFCTNRTGAWFYFFSLGFKTLMECAIRAMD